MKKFCILLGVGIGCAACLLPSCAIYSPESAPGGFVYVSDVVPDVILEIRYYSTGKV